MADDIKSGKGPGRIGLIDAVRGAALIAMASYHFTWDLEFFDYVPPQTATTGFFRLYARAIASSFLFLAGVSLVLAHGRGIGWQAFARRFAMVAGAAALISIATRFAMPEEWIFFGILHQIALASLIGLLFLRLPPLVPFLTGVAAIAVPNLWRSPVFDASPLLWIGLSDHLPRSNDYVPLLPWIGPFLIGIAAARWAEATGLFPRLRLLGDGPRALVFIGRHSLAFYLMHQPLLIALVYLATVIAPPQKTDSVVGYIENCQNACQIQGESADTCTKFCKCTLDKLLEQELFTPLQSGAIQTEQDERILKLARECTAISH